MLSPSSAMLSCRNAWQHGRFFNQSSSVRDIHSQHSILAVSLADISDGIDGSDFPRIAPTA
jgi:hypothetical protein